MKKICFFNSLNFWGGGEKLHLEFAVQFKELGYDVIVACAPGSPLEERSVQHGLKTVSVSVGNLSFLNPSKVTSIKKLFQQEAIDTVIFSSSQDMKMASKAGFQAGVKRRVYLRGLAVPVKRSGVNQKSLSTYVTHIVANSEETKNLIATNFQEREIREKIHVIYHGIDLDEFDSKKEKESLGLKQRHNGRFLIGNAGRLTEQKGHHLLVQVAAILKKRHLNFQLVIAGTGELEEELKSQIERLDLQDEVELLGFVKDVPAFMNEIDLFALSSLWEGFGFVIVEAMACNKPVVAFDISSNPEIVDQGKTGYLVPPKDIEAFADKIQLLMEDDELRNKLSLEARKSVEERFRLSDRTRELESHLLNSN